MKGVHRGKIGWSNPRALSHLVLLWGNSRLASPNGEVFHADNSLGMPCDRRLERRSGERGWRRHYDGGNGQGSGAIALYQKRADEVEAQASPPREVEVTVPGVWKSRLAGVDKAAWVSEKSPAKVTIKPSQVYAFDVARDITDEQLAGLKALKDVPLRDLTVASARMSDVGMAHIAQLSSVRYLYLSACGRVTDEGLAHLKKMADLEQLWVTANVQITDEGMKSLAELNKLRWLSLFGCKRVTDEGARRLKSLSSLKFVFLGGTGVTDTGVADLQKALPRCEVKR